MGGVGAAGRMVPLEGGVFLQGGADADAVPGDGEGPVRAVRLAPFAMAQHAVTNERFARFVRATGYRTQAERSGWSFVFSGFVGPAAARVARGAVAAAPWWWAVEGACWRRPEGPGSGLDHRAHHPVVHVSHDDARALAAWAGVRLPTEAEWEYAARGGLEQRRYPWGDELTPGGGHRCNIWQGSFPQHNTAADGHVGTAPVGTYRPNGHALFNMAGNVWEWCADWFGTDHPAGDPLMDPRGPQAGTARVLRGGSYLCHYGHCNRYRVAARHAAVPDSTAGNVGFRLAAAHP